MTIQQSTTRFHADGINIVGGSCEGDGNDGTSSSAHRDGISNRNAVRLFVVVIASNIIKKINLLKNNDAIFIRRQQRRRRLRCCFIVKTAVFYDYI